MTEPRDDVVQRLVDAHDQAEIEEVFSLYEPTTDEAKAASVMLTGAAIANLQSAGVIPASSHSVYDLDVRALTALAAVTEVVNRTYIPRPSQSPKLGDCLKRMPPEDVATVEFALRWGGFVDVDDVPPEG